MASVEPFYKPIPKPRCKPLDKPVQSDTVPEVSQTVEKARTPSESSNSGVVSSSARENVPCVAGERSPNETHSNDTDSHSRGDSEDGNFNSDPPPVSAALVPWRGRHH